MRIKGQMDALLDPGQTSPGTSSSRSGALATKADVREELDKLKAHGLGPGDALRWRADRPQARLSVRAQPGGHAVLQIFGYRTHADWFVLKPRSINSRSRCRMSPEVVEIALRRRGLMLVLSSPSGPVRRSSQDASSTLKPIWKSRSR